MADDVEAWRERVRILQAFGPAECVTWFVKDITDSSSETISFGRPPNIHGWIVDPDDSETLLPIGAVGELLIEGPALFVEYLNDPAKTEASIINAPSWRTSIGAPSVHQIYKSGDLVQYLPNGEMTYAGRKDAMIKLSVNSPEFFPCPFPVCTSNAICLALSLCQDEGPIFRVPWDDIVPSAQKTAVNLLSVSQ